MKTIYRYEIRRNKNTTLIFTLICTGMLFFVMAVYPLFKDMLGDMTDMMAELGAFSEMFSMDKLDYGSAQDYYATEGGAMLSLCGSILAALLGGSMLGREEGERTGEWLLTHPVGRGKVFAGKLLAVATLLFGMNLVCAVGTGLSFPMIGESLNVKSFVLFFVSQFVMHMEIACISMLISSFMRRSAGFIGLGVALVMYFLYLIASALEELEAITYITPFAYCDPAKIFSDGCIDMVRMCIGIAAATLFGLTAFIRWCRKDIAA